MGGGLDLRRSRFRTSGFAVAMAVAAIAACNESGDYLAVAGGGFIFNYRIAEASYGIALKPMREIPAGSAIEASLENPAGGGPFLIRKEGPFNPTRIAFTTPPVEGIVKDRPYKVTVVLKDAAGDALQTIEKTFSSQLDQSALPERPLAIGPGYQKNIDESSSAYPPSIDARPPVEAPR